MLIPNKTYVCWVLLRDFDVVFSLIYLPRIGILLYDCQHPPSWLHAAILYLIKQYTLFLFSPINLIPLNFCNTHVAHQILPVNRNYFAYACVLERGGFEIH